MNGCINSFMSHNWLANFFGEIFDPNRDSSHIDFQRFNKKEFDADKAYSQCEKEMADELSQEEKEYYRNAGVYDDITDDPDFDAESLESWEDANPRPDDDDEDEEEAWEEERRQVDANYWNAVSDWEERNSRKRNRTEWAWDTYRNELISQCVETKREESGDDDDDDNFDGFRYDFEHNGTRMVVEFVEMTQIEIERQAIMMNVSNRDLTVNKLFGRSFWVMLQGSKGYDSTNDKGFGAFAIYQELVQAVSKFIQSNEVIVIGWSAQEIGMVPIYKRFGKMLEGQFVPIFPGIYMRQSFLKEFELGDPQEIAQKSKEKEDEIMLNVKKSKVLFKAFKSVKGKIVAVSYAPNRTPGYIEWVGWDNGMVKMKISRYTSNNLSIDKLFVPTKQEVDAVESWATVPVVAGTETMGLLAH